MSLEAGSLEDVEKWAEKKGSQYIEPLFEIFGLACLKFDGEYTDNKIILQSMMLTAVAVGEKKTGEFVYARITGRDNVELFSEERVESQTCSKKCIKYLKPVVGLADVEFDDPFKFPIELGHSAAIDRLEALIRYCYLVNGEATAVQQKLGFFKTHFPAVCRDVANSKGYGMLAGEVYEDGDAVPDLVVDSEPAGLCDNPTTTSVFNDHVHAMDESYHDFKASVLRQLGEIQMANTAHVSQLQTKVHDLERRLAASEEGRRKLQNERKVEQTKAHGASEEARNWKSQYEGLKQTLQGALVQHF